MKIGYLIDSFLSKFGYRFLCFSPYHGIDEHLNNEKAVLHLPDLVGGVRCIWCNRLKGIHRTIDIWKK